MEKFGKIEERSKIESQRRVQRYTKFTTREKDEFQKQETYRRAKVFTYRYIVLYCSVTIVQNPILDGYVVTVRFRTMEK